MLEMTDSLLPQQTASFRSLCIGREMNSLEELKQLLKTLGIQTQSCMMLSSSHVIHPATYIGQGKIQEMKEILEHSQIHLVVFDGELAPNQLRNLEKQLKVSILDRPAVIIEIFSRHARTRESKTQVALARLQYLMPRLTHFWNHFERQRGGAVASRGMGEKQIEVDRRLIKARISLLRKHLSAVQRERAVQRSARSALWKVALVGYTNAGKSTLLNALTQSEVRAEDQLFVTLDPSVRLLNPKSRPPIVAIDTVGFISRLPPALVASFKATLEELQYADLLVHVVDASHPQAKEQKEVTENILQELKLHEKPRITILNKKDQLPEGLMRNQARLLVPGALLMSAFDEADLVKLRESIFHYFIRQLSLWEVLIPYSESKLKSQLHEYAQIELSRYLEKGTFYRLRIEEEWAKKLGLEKYQL